ncbi:MAG TPA: MOSC N-terminal beta barrel domain-containing protein [Spirochaetia bacterium]|nr:MOSC N-terminal beta barrel domain-containing protein [Spirochaetia bacterium]
MPMRISAITIYPVKSLAGNQVTEAEVTGTGFRNDRSWMIVGDDGIFITQRQHPALALVQAELTANGIRLTVPGREPMEIAARDDGDRVPVEVWEQPCDAADQGDDAASLFSEYLGRDCRLVRMHAGFRRRIKPKYYTGDEASLSFADSMPFLLISEASLDELNGRLDEPLPMNRFRPNLVVAGGAAYQEDRWHRIRVGSILMRVVKSCIRCEMTTIDQATAAKGIEPLETLGTYRSGAKGVLFGRHLLHESLGVIHLGDEVEVIE